MQPVLEFFSNSGPASDEKISMRRREPETNQAELEFSLSLLQLARALGERQEEASPAASPLARLQQERQC